MLSPVPKGDDFLARDTTEPTQLLPSSRQLPPSHEQPDI